MCQVSVNKNVFSSRLNSVRQMSCCRSSAGRLFHSRGPATPKLLSRSLDCVRGTVHLWTSADQRCRCPTSVTSWQTSDRYGGGGDAMYDVRGWMGQCTTSFTITVRVQNTFTTWLRSSTTRSAVIVRMRKKLEGRAFSIRVEQFTIWLSSYISSTAEDTFLSISF